MKMEPLNENELEWVAGRDMGGTRVRTALDI